jgi:putative oxidoreductase
MKEDVMNNSNKTALYSNAVDATGKFEKVLSVFKAIVSTPNDPAVTVARVILGAVFFAHGAQKMLGWFGGYGFNGTMGFFTQQMGIPAVFAFLAIAAEFFGGLGLIVGLLGRIAAFGILSTMVVAIAMVHAPYGFFMNWAGNQKGEGFEYHLLAIALAAVVVIKGSGALSLDWLLNRKLNASTK